MCIAIYVASMWGYHMHDPLFVMMCVSLVQDELHPQQVIVENAVQRTQSRIARRSLKR